MFDQWTRWVAGTGALLLTLGVGFAVNHDPPFVQVGTLLGIVGLVCVLLAGWVDFGRESRS